MMKALPGVFMALLVLGSLVYSVWAQMTEPALEPALTFMRWQAAWSGGTYGVKLTFAVTWSVLLFGGVVPIAAGSQVVEALPPRRGGSRSCRRGRGSRGSVCGSRHGRGSVWP